MTLFETLVSRNPMLIEITRYRRKFLSFKGATSNAIALGLSLCCYVVLILVVMNLLGSIPPVVLVMIQTGAFVLLGPSMLHGAIAGEREKRSWDLLLAAPVTKAQVVVGKFIGALAVLGITAILFLIPIVMAAASYRGNQPFSSGGRLNDLILAEAVSLSFCVLVCAVTMLFSARCKRGFMALGATMGVLFGGLVVLPLLLVPALIGSDMVAGEMFFLFHPFYALSKLTQSYEGIEETSGLPLAFYGWPQVTGYLVFAVLFVVWTVQTLRFADGEAKFLPGRSDARG